MSTVFAEDQLVVLPDPESNHQVIITSHTEYLDFQLRACGTATLALAASPRTLQVLSRLAWNQMYSHFRPGHLQNVLGYSWPEMLLHMVSFMV